MDTFLVSMDVAAVTWFKVTNDTYAKYSIYDYVCTAACGPEVEIAVQQDVNETDAETTPAPPTTPASNTTSNETSRGSFLAASGHFWEVLTAVMIINFCIASLADRE